MAVENKNRTLALARLVPATPAFDGQHGFMAPPADAGGGTTVLTYSPYTQQSPAFVGPVFVTQTSVVTRVDVGANNETELTLTVTGSVVPLEVLALAFPAEPHVQTI